MNKLFIIGLPRTGTTSISVSLLDHGFKVAHTAYTKRAFELADVISDTPCFCDYRQLDQLFPQSKFVYLNRELSDWVPSIQLLLKKMSTHLEARSSHFTPILKRCFNQTFALLTTDTPLDHQHLEACYLSHQKDVFDYFSKRDDFLSIDVSQTESLQALLAFLDITTDELRSFPRLNANGKVNSWREFKHPNKINANSAGKEHRQFFNY